MEKSFSSLNSYFKIVSTKEKQGIYFSVVPCRWEQGGTLSWPGHLNFKYREQLRSNAASLPEDNWAKYPCIVKCTELDNFTEALKIEKQLSDCINTDAEEELFENFLHPKMNKKKSINTCFTDRNDMFENASKKSKKVDYENNKIQDTHTDNINVFVEDENVLVRTLLVAADGSTIDEDIAATESSDIVNNGSSQELEIIKNEITKLKNEFKIFRDEIREDNRKIVLNLDKIFRILSTQDHMNDSQVLPPIKESLLEKEKFPLETVDDISKLEEKIRNNQDFRQELVDYLSQIGGRTGVQDGTKIAYKLVDNLFKPDVLTKYSWTGVSRQKNEEKKPFQSYDGILGVFFEVLLMADNRHTQNRNCTIFKECILKHAKKRSSRKRRSVDPNDLLITEMNENNNEEINDNINQDDEEVTTPTTTE